MQQQGRKLKVPEQGSRDSQASFANQYDRNYTPCDSSYVRYIKNCFKQMLFNLLETSELRSIFVVSSSAILSKGV